MARDMVHDSEKAGKCFIPKTMFKDPEFELNAFVRQKNPSLVGKERIQFYEETLCKMGLKYYEDNSPGLRQNCPAEIRFFLNFVADVYIRCVVNISRKNSGILCNRKTEIFWKLFYLLRYTYYDHFISCLPTPIKSMI